MNGRSVYDVVALIAATELARIGQLDAISRFAKCTMCDIWDSILLIWHIPMYPEENKH